MLEVISRIKKLLSSTGWTQRMIRESSVNLPLLIDYYSIFLLIQSSMDFSLSSIERFLEKFCPLVTWAFTGDQILAQWNPNIKDIPIAE